MSNQINKPHCGVTGGLPAVHHPTWCSPGRCTAEQDPATGAHCSTPAHLTPDALGLGLRLSVTAELVQAHARWMTEPYMSIEVSALADDGQPIHLTAKATATEAADLGRLLLNLAEPAEADHVARASSTCPRCEGGAVMSRPDKAIRIALRCRPA